MGDFSKLNKMISAQEKFELRNRGADNEFMDYYFYHKNKEELNKKDKMKLPWNETNILNDIRKQEDETENTTPLSLDEQYSKLMDILAQCVYLANKTGQDDLSDDFLELKVLFSKLNPISKKCNKKIKKSNIKKSKSSLIFKSLDNTVEGFCTSEIVDSQGDFVPISEMKKTLPQYLKNHASLNLNHSNRIIGRVLSADFRKTDSGNNGLYIKAKIYDDNYDVIKNIQKYNGFSIAGIGGRENTCDTEKCFNVVKDFKLYEISLVENPANQESYITKR